MEVPLRSKFSSSDFLPVPPVLRSASPNKKMAGLARPRLLQYDTFEHAVKLLQASSKIIVLTGAGISTSLGIRDFRSENGLYNFLGNRYKIGDPQELFHIETFEQDPQRFYNIIRHVVPSQATGYSPTHGFIKLLQDQGKLLTNYTQNIDDLEQAASIDPKKIVQCHGSLATATCMTCGKVYKARKYLPVLHNPNRTTPLECGRCWGPNGDCPNWKKPKKARTKKRKRDYDEDDDDDDLPKNFGILKPGIVFFGEPITDTFGDRLEEDMINADLLIIIGTSLKVAPVMDIPRDIPASVPQVYINAKRCRLEGVSPDIQLLGKCDVVVEELARRAGWNLEHDMIDSGADSVRVELIEGTPNQYRVWRTAPSVSNPSRPTTPIINNTDLLSSHPSVKTPGLNEKRPTTPMISTAEEPSAHSHTKIPSLNEKPRSLNFPAK